MGHSSSNSNLIFPYSKYPWIEAPIPNTLKCIYNQIYASYLIVKELCSLDMKCLQFRTLNHNYLVNVLAIIDNNLQSNQNILPVIKKYPNTQNKGYTILIQKINYRLPDLGIISFKDGLYILKQAVKAIKILNTLFANFIIEEEFIGINGDGICKFWINANYFFNYHTSNILHQETSALIKTSLTQSIMKEQQNCQLTSTYKPTTYQPNRNIYEAFTHLLQQIELRMIQNMNQNQKQKYHTIKHKYINSLTSSFQQKNTNIQIFVALLCQLENVGQNYRIYLPNNQQQNKKISLKRIKSQQKLSIQTQNEESHKYAFEKNSKILLKNKRKCKTSEQKQTTSTTNVTKSYVKYQQNDRTNQNEQNALTKFSDNYQSRIWSLIS